MREEGRERTEVAGKEHPKADYSHVEEKRGGRNGKREDPKRSELFLKIYNNIFF